MTIRGAAARLPAPAARSAITSAGGWLWVCLNCVVDGLLDYGPHDKENIIERERGERK